MPRRHNSTKSTKSKVWWRGADKAQWLKQCRLEGAAELQQWWHRTNRLRKSIPLLSSSHREGSITQRGASCGRYDQRRRIEAPRRRRREPTSAVEWRVSARYDGAVPIRQRYARTYNRNWILSWTFSQCSSQRSGVMCSDFLAENTRRAAALKTNRSRCNSCPEIPERTEMQ